MSDEVIKVRVQKMWPNCSKYTHCCDVNWNPRMENVKDVPKPNIVSTQPHITNLIKPSEFDQW